MKSPLARLSLVCLAVVVAVLGLVALAHAGGSGAVPAGSDLAVGFASSPSASPSEAPTELATPSVPPSVSPSASSVPSVASSASRSPSSSRSPLPSQSPKPTAKIPKLPIAGNYTFPIHGCSIAYSHSHHDYPASDIYAAIGCSFVAPTSGVVDEVSLSDKWAKGIRNGATRGGLTVSMVGSDGVRYYGAHLSAVAAGIRPGVHVTVGQLLGKTGNSGNAKGEKPHLHFGISWPTAPGIWWVRRGEVYPWPYLDAWRAGTGKSPAGAVSARHKAVGDGPCTVYC